MESVDFDYDAVDRGNPLVAELTGARDKTLPEIMQRFRRVILQIYESNNSKKSAACFLIATGDPAADGIAMATQAKRFGVSKAAVSKSCVEWCEFLSIRPSRYMRSAESGQSFQKSNHRPKK